MENLNQRTWHLVEAIARRHQELRIVPHLLPNGARVFDFGVEAEGGLAAGLQLARVCTANLAEIAVVPADIAGQPRPHVQVSTDRPVAACLLSQYAGWQIGVENFFGMGSGPMRAASAAEVLFETLKYREVPTECVGVLESSRLPDAAVVEAVCEKTNVAPQHTALCVAPTSSQAGNVQVVAALDATHMHKLFELGFDVRRIQSGYGLAPLPPPAENDLAGIGRTNDAILYGGRVVLWVRGDDASLAEIGPKVPAESSPSFGKPFSEVFQAAGGDFYALDPRLFSPAVVEFVNLDTGRTHAFGRTLPEVLATSFGWTTK